MPTIRQDLKLKTDATTIVYPNIIGACIPSGAVDATHLASGAVTTAKLDSNAVTAGKIASDAVITAKILDGAVTHAKLADDAVDTNNIVDEAVSTAKIKDGAVTTQKIGDLSVTRGKMALRRFSHSTILSEHPTLADFIDYFMHDATYMRRTRVYGNSASWFSEFRFACDGAKFAISYFDSVDADWKREIATNDTEYLNMFMTHAIVVEVLSE